MKKDGNTANVRDLRTAFFLKLHRHDSSFKISGPSNHKRIGIFSALQQLSLFDDLPKLSLGEYLGYEQRLSCSWCWEKLLVALS